MPESKRRSRISKKRDQKVRPSPKRYPKKPQTDQARLEKRRLRLSEKSTRRRTPLDAKVDKVDAYCLRKGFYKRSVWHAKEADNLDALRRALSSRPPRAVISLVASEAHDWRSKFGKSMFCFTPVRVNQLSHLESIKDRSGGGEVGGVRVPQWSLSDLYDRFCDTLTPTDIQACWRAFHRGKSTTMEKLKSVGKSEKSAGAMLECMRLLEENPI